ncbi:MAG: translation initiation factor IF-2 [Deltaproteobacteria bacterium]|nr:MAG: translation initiation factor IF-2 [Deltaproteobacteria bacterium]
MAKIRVYELARDLNMTNKILVDKIRDMDISIKSHMSSLDQNTVAKIKANLFGKKQEVIETRIKPTVIRRRRKTVQMDIVAEPETQLKNEILAEKAVEAEATDVITAKEDSQVTGPAASNPEEEITAKVTVAEDVPIEGVLQETNEPAPADDKSALPEKVEPKKRVKKPKKKEPAAKIIRLPVTPKVKPPQKEEPEVLKPAAKVKKISQKVKPYADDALPSVEQPVKEIKKKKHKKEKEEQEIDKKFLKKKISFRRKEVVEGEDLYARGRRIRKSKKAVKAKAPAVAQKTQITTAKAIKRRIKIDDAIVLSDLAKRMGIKASEMIKTLMTMGVMATVNQTIDFDTAVLVAGEFDYDVERATFEEEAILQIEKDDPEKLIERPPVVTIMGHVDHGKTSLLDVIRKTKITDIEAGGITQHIGAYHVATDKGQIAFLDTPGHEAFTAMRARGAKLTDIVVLVVAADDGVMPQTLEAINHSRAAGVPIIVAVNKIDKSNADPERVYRELSEVGLTPEEWGGDTIFVKVSAKQNLGIDELLEMILLQSEVLELKANPNKSAKGYVVESKIDPGRGAVATVLVQEGTLRTGDPVVCGVHHGKIRALLNDRGVQVESAGPSIPVEVIGLSGVPMAGAELIALKDEKDAKQVSEYRIQKQRSKELAQTSRLSLEKLYEKMREGEVKDLNLIIKADVRGSIEALSDSLTKLSNEEVKINIVHSGAGTIAESDVSLAALSDAIIIGFNVRPTPKVQSLANEENVDMRFYSVIYDVIKDVKNAIAGMMASTFVERVLGRAEVREIFHVPRVGTIAGCYVTDGKIERSQPMRILRDGVVLYEGRNSSLRRYKDDVKEVMSGYECGVGIENYNDIKVGDMLESFYLEEIKPEIE